jgi:type I restriction enzyme, S subunit
MGVENNIPEGWLYTELGKVSENIFSGGTPNTRINKYWNGSLNWLSSGETGSNFIYSTIKSITQLGVDNSSTRLALKDDVVVATAGQGNTRGQVSFMCIDSYINQSIIAIRGNKNALFNKWLFYNLSYRYKELRFISESNSVRGSITTKMLSSLIKLKLPPLPEQKAIAKVLTAFDDKIELFQAQNKTLETMAQTIFKEWFGKYQIGDDLPEGWRVGKLGEIAKLKSGYAFKSKDFVEESNYKALKIKDLKGNGRVSVANVSSIDESCVKIERVLYFKLIEGDIVLAMSGNTTGKIGIVPPNNIELYLNQRVGKFFLLDTDMTSYLYNFLMSGNYEDKILSMGYGSAQPNISPSQIENIDLFLPKDGILQDYLNIGNPIFDKVLKNNSQIQNLKQTRDTLLPKLMSGKLRVNEFKEN